MWLLNDMLCFEWDVKTYPLTSLTNTTVLWLFFQYNSGEPAQKTVFFFSYAFHEP